MLKHEPPFLTRYWRSSLFGISLLGLIVFCPAKGRAADPPKPVDFSHEIVPLLKLHCAKCHAGESKKGSFSFNTRGELLRGGESGLAVEPKRAKDSRLIELVTSTVEGERMPPEGERLKPAEVDLLKRWIDGGLVWEEGFAFKANAYEPPLKPRRPELPAVRGDRTNPIDRIIDDYLSQRGLPTPAMVDDGAFARRVSLDLTGLLPEIQQVDDFLRDNRSDKRARLVDELLADDVAYAEHWLTLWNDLLRNDYDGTGFITGGRKQISRWLYDSLVNNKPYDQFVRELISPPTDESRGFIEGIKWRGDVSAGQTVEIQFAQSISQSLLGINLKCASCHDSFIDRWKLSEAYGLAAIYSTRPLEIHRCDKPIGRMAEAEWLFPELGQVEASAAQPERLRQLAGLMTHPDNGRFTRTIVNRLWHRLIGRGIVHPTDAMHTAPWNADLLDFLASDFADHGHDLKHTLRLIANSAAYQSQSQVLADDDAAGEFQFQGPRGKRMTAEQFMDSVWQLTGAAPTKMDAKLLRGKLEPGVARSVQLTAQWIWSSSGQPEIAAGEKRTFRKKFELSEPGQEAGAAISCDNQFTLYVNGKKVIRGDDWTAPVAVALGNLPKGANELMIVAENLGKAPNPAGLFVQARFGSDDSAMTLNSDSSWEWSAVIPKEDGKFPTPPTDWQPAVPLNNQSTWRAANDELQNAFARSAFVPKRMLRAALLKSNPLMRTLGRPNRDQIVSMRPNDLSTLEALDLANGAALAKMLTEGAETINRKTWADRSAIVDWLYRAALSREPTPDELLVGLELLAGLPSADSSQAANDVSGLPSVRSIEDLLWAVIMLPEFQLVR